MVKDENKALSDKIQEAEKNIRIIHEKIIRKEEKIKEIQMKITEKKKKEADDIPDEVMDFELKQLSKDYF